MREIVRIDNISMGVLDSLNWYVGTIRKNKKKDGEEYITCDTYHDDPAQACRRLIVRASYSPDLASIEQVAEKMESTLQMALEAFKTVSV